MFISFEGLDLCGKTTQSQLLVERLTSLGKRVVYLREPGGTEISEKIRDILLDLRHSEMSAKAELFLFSAARTQLVSQVIKPAIAEGTFVICDRFYDSTTAYQGFGRGINLEEIHAINRIAVDGTIPDLTLFISVPLDEILRRQQIKKGIDRMESSGIQFYERVLHGFEQLATAEPSRFVVINGMQTKEEVHNTIWNSIQQRLSNKISS
ncbi:MAG: dTMP kinase [Ignavibacteriae bacterium]|nr:dTMP kinase [Ignavibacteriota bacterium]